MFGVSLNFDKQGPDNPKIQQMLDNHLFYIWPLTRPVLEKTRESVQQILPRFPSSKVLVAVFNHKISDFCNSTSVLIEKPEPYSLPTVSHMCASLCSCSILSCSILSCSFLSCSFLCASSAYHALKIYGEQDWLMRSRHHWLNRKIPSASTNEKYIVSRKARTVTPDIKIRSKFFKSKKSPNSLRSIHDRLYKHWWLQLIN